MKCDKKDLLLYAVTDRSWLKEQTLCKQVEEALMGGATFVQLREKELDDEAFLAEAIEIQKLCKKYNVPFPLMPTSGNERITSASPSPTVRKVWIDCSTNAPIALRKARRLGRA